MWLERAEFPWSSVCLSLWALFGLIRSSWDEGTDVGNKVPKSVLGVASGYLP